MEDVRSLLERFHVLSPRTTTKELLMILSSGQGHVLLRDVLEYRVLPMDTWKGEMGDTDILENPKLVDRGVDIMRRIGKTGLPISSSDDPVLLDVISSNEVSEVDEYLVLESNHEPRALVVSRRLRERITPDLIALEMQGLDPQRLLRETMTKLKSLWFTLLSEDGTLPASVTGEDEYSSREENIELDLFGKSDLITRFKEDVEEPTRNFYVLLNSMTELGFHPNRSMVRELKNHVFPEGISHRGSDNGGKKSLKEEKDSQGSGENGTNPMDDTSTASKDSVTGAFSTRERDSGMPSAPSSTDGPEGPAVPEVPQYPDPTNHKRVRDRESFHKEEVKRGLAIVYNPSHIRHQPSKNFPETPRRISQIMNVLQKYRVFDDRCMLVEVSSPVDKRMLRTVHTEEHVHFVESYSRSGGGVMGDSAYFNSYTYKAACLSAACCTRAVDLVVDGEVDIAWALNRPPGHHANSERHAGFCIFNNAAIATKYAQSREKHKVAIIDFDAHAANGTLDIFETDPTVLLLSIHQSPKDKYPYTGFMDQVGKDEGEGTVVNMVMPEGAGNREYKTAYTSVVRPVLFSFDPDLVICCLGFDTFHKDNMSNLSMDIDGYHWLAGQLRRDLAGKLVVVTEGGYTEDMGTLGHSALCGFKNLELPYEKTYKPSSSDEIRISKEFGENLMVLKKNILPWFEL